MIQLLYINRHLKTSILMTLDIFICFILGNDFIVESVSGVGKAAVKITKRKIGGMVMRNDNYNTQRAI